MDAFHNLSSQRFASLFLSFSSSGVHTSRKQIFLSPASIPCCPLFFPETLLLSTLWVSSSVWLFPCRVLVQCPSLNRSCSPVSSLTQQDQQSLCLAEDPYAACEVENWPTLFLPCLS